ncbi:hypothetical protein, partial [Escherichia coli]
MKANAVAAAAAGAG